MDEFKKSLKENWRLIVFAILVILTLVIISIYKSKTSNGKIISNDDLKEINTDEGFSKKEYKANEYQIIEVNEMDVISDYYKDFIKNAINNPDEAYKRLSSESKNIYNNVESFKEYFSSIKTTHTKNNTIKSYLQDKKNEHKYQIIDSENRKYIIVENAVWDYEITIEN